MRKACTSVLLALAFLLAFQVGSAFAAEKSKLEQIIEPLIGIHYSYGGTTTRGFDCSGFTSYVFKKLGIELPRTSRDQAMKGKKVAKSDLLPGDIVYFNTSGKGVSHVGIYIGDGKFAHSSTSKGVTITKLSDKYYAQRYLGARRIMDAETYQEVAADPAEVEEEQVAEADSAASADEEAEVTEEATEEAA